MSFHKSQKFTLLGRIPTLADRHTKETGHDRLYPVGESGTGRLGGPSTPGWLEYDMKVLCFDGYFHEHLAEMQQSGSYRIRRVKIAFFLEDETVQVVEPKILNSGLPQGNIVKRQRVTETTSSPENKKFVTLLDFNVDKTVTIFDRTYHITSCDPATRRFLTRLGVTVPEPVPVPTDPGHERRQMAERATRAKNKTSTKDKKFAQFLQNYRKVLLFFGYWDDRASAFGDLRRLVVHYYLADDTVEIKESYPPNSGRHESSGIFLKRMRLPKQGDRIPDIGQSTATFAVLNVMGDNFNSGRFIPDAVDSRERTDYYSYMDLGVGREINVFGRKLMLTSCDDFTKKFYRDNFGVEEFPDVPLPTTEGAAAANEGPSGGSRLSRKYERQLPPFNGWGSHEDSEGNCKSQHLQPPSIDYDKFVRLDGKMLRFTSKMVTKSIENLERTFIITYYLSNDTIAVFEIPRRNSGFAGGQFLHPQRFFLPGQDLTAAERPKQYTPQHLYIGARLNLNSHIFQIVGADDFALEYMEQHRNQFPFSDVNVILQKCRNQFVDKIHYKNLMAKYWNGPGEEEGQQGEEAPYPADKLRQLLHELLPGGITEHEILTVCRHFSLENQRKLDGLPKKSPENKALVRNIVQAELQRNLWSDWEALGHYVKYIGAYGETDNGTRQFLSPSKILTVVRGTRLPLNPGQVELMLYVLEKNDVGDISVTDFLAFLRRDSSAEAVTSMQPLSLAINKSCEAPRRGSSRVQAGFIDWNKFVASIAV